MQLPLWLAEGWPSLALIAISFFSRFLAKEKGRRSYTDFIVARELSLAALALEVARGRRTMIIFVACVFFITLAMNYIPEKRPAFVKKLSGHWQDVVWWAMRMILLLFLDSFGILAWFMAYANWLEVLK